MSDYASILERTRQAFAAVSKLEMALQRNPMNPALEMNLRARRRLAERFQEELFSIAAISQIDVCQYKLRPNDTEHFPISEVSRSLASFQDLFSLIYAAQSEGTKNTAHLSGFMRAETQMEFGYSYAGSLGIVLVVPSTRGLFATKFEATIAAMDQLLAISDRDDVLDVARTLGRAIVNKVYEWSLTNYSADFSVDIYWRKSDGRFSGGAVDKTRLARLTDIIGMTSEETIVEFERRGVLVGIDVPTRWFHFVVPEGDSYTGYLGPEISVTGTIEVNRRYRCHIREHTTRRLATDQEQRQYRACQAQDKLSA